RVEQVRLIRHRQSDHTAFLAGVRTLNDHDVLIERQRAEHVYGMRGEIGAATRCVAQHFSQTRGSEVNGKDAIISFTANPQRFPNECAMIWHEMIVFVLDEQRLAVPDGIALPLKGSTNSDRESRLSAEWIRRRKQKRWVA